jgi:hypothetical protein
MGIKKLGNFVRELPSLTHQFEGIALEVGQPVQIQPKRNLPVS